MTRHGGSRILLVCALLAAAALMTSCWITDVTGPAAVFLGTEVEYLVDMEPYDPQPGPWTGWLAVYMPPGWEILSCEYEGTVGGVPVQGVGTILEPPFPPECDDPAGGGAGYVKGCIQSQEHAVGGSGTVTARVRFSVGGYAGEHNLAFGLRVVTPTSSTGDAHAIAVTVWDTAIFADGFESGDISAWRSPDTITIALPDGSTMDLVWVPAGEFWMGSPPDERGRTQWEDLHLVTLTTGYYLGEREVTQAQWEAVMGAPAPTSCGGWDGGVGPSHPVSCVSWNEVCGGSTGSDCLPESFVGRLNTHLGETRLRLPTDAEWERAARAGTQTEFSFPAPPDWEIECGPFPEAMPFMWWCGNSSGRDQPVGWKLANDFGLYDMHGNNGEWVADWWQDHLGTDPQTDPMGPHSGSERVSRGGYWRSKARHCRSAFRGNQPPENRYVGLGFRLAMSP